MRSLVKVHPESKRKTLSIGRHARAVLGLSQGDSEELLVELVYFARQPARIYHYE